MADFKIRGVPRRSHQFGRKRLVGLILLIAVLIVAWLRRADIMAVFSAMSKGALVPLICAGLAELGRIVFHAHAYTRSFGAVGYKVPLTATIPAWFKAVFINTVLPTGGTSGLAAVIDTARRRGVPVGSATTGTIFTQTCYYASMFFVVCVGFVVLGRAGMLTGRDVVLGSVMGIAALAFLSMLALGHLKPGLLQRIMRKVERTVVRICTRLHLKKTPKPWADELSHSYSIAATELSRQPVRALRVLVSMLIAVGFDALCFVASGYAFGIDSLPALLGGYTTVLVFNSFTITPGGVGVVEGMTSAVLAGYAYPAPLAVSCVLTYRAFMYWIPFAIGAVAVRVSGRSSEVVQTAATSRSTSSANGTASVEDTLLRAARAAKAAQASVAAREAARSESEAYEKIRRARLSRRERILGFIREHLAARPIVCAALVAFAGVTGLVVSVMPANQAIVEILVRYANLTDALDGMWLASFSYAMLLLVPGLVFKDQGNWIVSIVIVVLATVVSGLAGHSIVLSVINLIVLVLLVAWHDSFEKHGYLQSIPRLARIMAYAAAIPVLYVVIGALGVCRDFTPSLSYVQTVWLGLQSLVGTADITVAHPGMLASQFLKNAWAMTVTFILAVLLVMAMVSIHRAIAHWNPEHRTAKARARAEAQAAARQRRDRRRSIREARKGMNEDNHNDEL